MRRTEGSTKSANKAEKQRSERAMKGRVLIFRKSSEDLEEKHATRRWLLIMLKRRGEGDAEAMEEDRVSAREKMQGIRVRDLGLEI
jgi:hypothetical protein